MTYNSLQGTFTTMIGFVTWPPYDTKPIIVVKVPCKLLYVIQVKEFLIKCSTSWPYLISEFLIAYITIVASDWPCTFFTPKVFLFSILLQIPSPLLKMNAHNSVYHGNSSAVAVCQLPSVQYLVSADLGENVTFFPAAVQLM